MKSDTARLLKPTVRPSGLTPEERQQQIAALPPGTSTVNIYPDHGWRVIMRRGGKLQFGGHHMDLSEAVMARDRMYEEFRHLWDSCRANREAEKLKRQKILQVKKLEEKIAKLKDRIDLIRQPDSQTISGSTPDT